MKTQLDCNGWRANWARDAKTAIAKVRRESFDLAVAERLWREDCGALLIEQPGCKSEQFLRSRETRANSYRLAAGTTKKRSIAIVAATPIGRSNNIPVR